MSSPSDRGENITQRAIDLLALSEGTKIHFLPDENGGHVGATGAHPIVSITGLRNPCPQIERFRKGLQERFMIRDANRNIVGRKSWYDECC
jgi:hypothetical protein